MLGPPKIQQRAHSGRSDLMQQIDHGAYGSGAGSQMGWRSKAVNRLLDICKRQDTEA